MRSQCAALLMSAALAAHGVFASHCMAQEAKDSSGTNPAVLSRNLTLSNEYRFLGDNYFFNITNVRYTEPFADGAASIRLTVPVVATGLPFGDTQAGLGDIAAKLSWVAYMSKSNAFILSSELYAPTATEDVYGTGKWVIAPGITWAKFVSPEIIVAPAYIHSLSFAGDDDREDVNRGDFDLYLVYKPHGEKWWITSDTTVSHDFESKTTPISWEVSFGRNLMVLDGGSAVNGYIRPGVGIGHDRPYNFNIEVGISIVNF